MSPEQQQIAIATACGWTEIDQCTCWHGVSRGYAPIPGAHKKHLPDYLADLNAMHEAEKVLFCDKWKWLAYVNNLNEMPSLQNEWLCVSIHATAAQRAEAFLRTLNLWQESPTQPQ
jgi:hypothetical protein